MKAGVGASSGCRTTRGICWPVRLKISPALMRRLAQPKVVASALLASALTAALCLPRILFWPNRPFSLWYVEATEFLGGFVLWAFVFAWHTEYTRRPVFTLKIKPSIFATAPLAGILYALGLHF